MERIADYKEYAYQPDNSWNLVEKRILEYCFRRFLKDEYGFLRDYIHNKNFPHIKTSFGSLLPANFSVLDLGTGTGRVAEELIKFGIPADRILGIDINRELLTDKHYPEGVRKIQADVSELPLVNGIKADQLTPFNFVTANMLFHTFSYEKYVECLKSVRKLMSERSMFLITVPHPYRDWITTISEYHDQHAITENGPWGGTVEYHVKTIQDYCRAFYEAGMYPFQQGETGVGLKVLGKIYDTDEAVWKSLSEKNRCVDLPRYYRMWWVGGVR